MSEVKENFENDFEFEKVQNYGSEIIKRILPFFGLLFLTYFGMLLAAAFLGISQEALTEFVIFLLSISAILSFLILLIHYKWRK